MNWTQHDLRAFRTYLNESQEQFATRLRRERAQTVIIETIDLSGLEQPVPFAISSTRNEGLSNHS